MQGKHSVFRTNTAYWFLTKLPFVLLLYSEFLLIVCRFSFLLIIILPEFYL